ncbi:MAG TPA: histidine kinase [Candidatus Dormibacteraeota bacterium]|nr:histidine kinase [Candidatus Dormibacteraeota bacterium]
MSWEAALGAQTALTGIAAAFVYLLLRRQRRGFGTLEERAMLRTLAFATSTLRALRSGLTRASAGQVLPAVAEQAAAEGVALYGPEGLMGFHPRSTGPAEAHRLHMGTEQSAVLDALAAGRLKLVDLHPPGGETCELRYGVVAPLIVLERPVAALVTYHLQTPGPAALRIASDLAELLATQLRLQAADQQRVALAKSELRALRAQISPHFIYNTLTTIASFIRTDPDRARELVQEFADFTRRAFRSQGEFTTLADELIYTRQYLQLEQARLGDRLQLRLHIDPEVLNTTVPTLVVQPLVENAIKHGIEAAHGGGTVEIRAEDQDDECLIVVKDNGAGFEVARATNDGGALANIDSRLRQVFGPGYRLEIQSRPGHGTTVQVRVPKYRPGVRAS